MTTASTPTDLARPPEETRVCIVAITRHGAAQAAQLARDLPEAHICTAAKFAQAFDGLPNPVRAYEGALRDEMAPLFAGYDQLVFFVSLGAVVRLIAPALKSKDEELELYEAEHRRLLEKEKLSDQLLQEADAELSRTKSELDALRYHAKELTDNLEAAKNLASSTPAAFGHSDLLLCFLKNKAGVVDQLRAVAVIYPEAVHLLPSALRSAEDAAEFKHLDRLRDLLLKLVCDYRETLVAGKGNNEAGRIFGRNDFTAKEAESLSRTGRAARTFSYNGGDIFMEQHLKIGVKDSAAHCLRLHFHWDAKAGKIVIGHCGKHLPL